MGGKKRGNKQKNGVRFPIFRFCHTHWLSHLTQVTLPQFWSLGHFTSPSIDTILDRSTGFTLDELLEEDELLQECKAQNAKLTE